MQSTSFTQRPKIFVVLLLIAATIGASIISQCISKNSSEATSAIVDIALSAVPPAGENREQLSFYVNEEVKVCIEALDYTMIDTMAFGAIVNPGPTVSESDCKSACDSMRSGTSLALKNDFTAKFDRPCEVLLVGFASSKESFDIDTLRLRIIEQPDIHLAPTISLQSIRKYAATTLPCSLKIAVANAEPWQMLTLSSNNPADNITFISDTLGIWTPTGTETARSHELTIVVTDDGVPQKSATGSETVTVLQDGEVLAQPQNLRVVDRQANFTELAWSVDPLADYYTVYRSLTGKDGSWEELTTKVVPYTDSTAKVYFYRVAAGNFFGVSPQSAMIIGCDTLNYATTVEFQNAFSTASESNAAHTIQLQLSEAAKMPITVSLSAKGISAGAEDFKLNSPTAIIYTGKTATSVQLTVTDDELAEAVESLTVTIDVVSSGYALGQLVHTVAITDNDRFYTVTYNGNGADGGSEPVDTNHYKKGNQATVLGNPNNLTKATYTFAGWNTASNGSGTNYAAGVKMTMGGANVTLFAKWTLTPVYTVTYNGNGNTGGSVPTPAKTYEEGASVTVLGNTGNFTKTGAAFTGWNTAADGSGASYKAEDKFTVGRLDITLYAQWSLNTFVVTFNSQGGSAVVPATIEYGATVPEPTAPTRLGYSFGGWYKEAACTNSWDFATATVTSAVTLYAKWKIKQYTVTYNGNTNTGGIVPAATAHDSNAIVTVAANSGSLVKTGYKFNGWNTLANGNGTTYPPGTGTFAISGNTTLYATWTIRLFTVTYNGNGNTSGSVPPASTYDSNTTVTAAENSGTLTRTGYTFGGWNTAANGNGTNYTAGTGTFTISGHLTLYAKWTIIPCTVTFNSQGGEQVASQTVNYGEHASTPISPTKTSYTFAKWFKEADCTNKWYFPSDSVTGPVTLYAKWEIRDWDNNLYTEVTIGTQTWMVGNLKTTTYRDGSSINGYYWYDNENGNKDIYGALYNWDAVNSGKLAPDGWRVATADDWTTLSVSCGNDNVAGGRLKSSNYWIENQSATDNYGFSAVGGGWRHYQNTYQEMGTHGKWWTANSETTQAAYYRLMVNNAAILYQLSENKACGFSVRCIRDW